MLRHAPVVIGWRDVSAASPRVPLRLLEAPGLATLRQNVAGVRIEHNPMPTHLDRIARARPRAVLAAFGPETLTTALRACQRLAAADVPPIAVRGHWLPAEARTDFADASFAPGLMPVLQALDVPLPASWSHPILLAEVHHPRVAAMRMGVLMSRVPEPGVLELRELFGDPAREGDPAASLDVDVDDAEARVVLQRLLAAGVRSVLVVDAGGDAGRIADLAQRRGMLGGFVGPARADIPEVVARAGCPVWTWFDPDDVVEGRRRVGSGVAWVPIGIADEGLPEAAARLLAIRELGYGAIVPRFHVPCPNTRAWRDHEARFGFRDARLDRLSGNHLVFRLPAWGPVEPDEVLDLLTRDNRLPEPPAGAGTPRRSISFEAMRQTLDDYLGDSVGRVPQCHARDVLASVLAAVGPAAESLQPSAEYPFVALGEHNLLDLVQRAIEARLLSLGDLPAELIAAIRHAALAGGKRIRPVLTLVMTCAWGVPLDAAMPAALATEWLHTASLIQDDLPCMDDDDIRRRDASTHRRHGEGVALLASDALVAMAFEDVTSLGSHPAVGPDRARRLSMALSRTIGAHGLVGGQALDLLTRRLPSVSLQDVLEVHRRKTVPLFRLTAELATILADTGEPTATQIVESLASLGLAFQIVDDVLDATADNDAFGRPAGSDRKNALPTFATLMDTAAGRRYARKLMEPHLRVLDGHRRLFGLQHLSTYVLERRQ